ncbi:MAG TPA: DEAD/DEAH box helicase [Thermoanaerobaculia bacterium]|jgi:ATP-dependent RNA helicase DeaD
MSTFAELGLRPELLEALTTLGYEAPTPIQERTIPRMLAGGDLIGQAQTGTGKTAAFALPILEKIDPKKKVTQALVLTPTRELAMQVAEAIHSYSLKVGAVSVLPVYGGAPIVPQLKRLERGAHVVVGTPGRLIDHLDRGSLDLSNVRVIVLDEADEMLKMGFVEEVEKLLAAAPAERQIALFSATMPEEVLRIAKRHQRNPERIEIEHKTINAPAIEQRFLNVSEGQKLDVLTQILELEPAEAVLIFRRTKNGSAELAEKLEGRGFSAVAMHGDMSQPLRESVIRRLRAGQVEIVVATDVAARGLDVEQIEHVINYDVPYDVEAYVHRIGRTGRAGRSGVATMFITPRERRMMREIERYTGTQIKPMKMPTRADLAAKRITVFKDSIRKTIAEGDLDMYVELVEQLVEEGPFDMADVAAAAARIANGSRALVKAKEQESAPEATAAPREYRDREDRPERSERPDRTPNPDDKTVRLVMTVGRNDGIRPADVVGSIANEADIPGRDIGPIDIQDDMTFVGIPERFVEIVLEKVGKKKFRGRAVNMRVARADEGSGERRPPRRDAGGPPPRRDFNGPPRRDFNGPPRRDAGGPPPRREFNGPPTSRPFNRDRNDAGARPRFNRDAGGPPRRDAGGPPARPFNRDRDDAGARPRFNRDAGGPPPRRDAGGPPRRDDAPRRGPSPFYSGFKAKKRPPR